jgi:hypothetical protein
MSQENTAPFYCVVRKSGIKRDVRRVWSVFGIHYFDDGTIKHVHYRRRDRSGDNTTVQNDIAKTITHTSMLGDDHEYYAITVAEWIFAQLPDRADYEILSIPSLDII